MLVPLINTGLIITLFALAAPFIFVLLVIKMVTGSNKKRSASHRTENDETETMNEISKGLRDLNRRIDNLETIKNRDKDRER
jgi:hypothetical protein